MSIWTKEALALAAKYTKTGAHYVRTFESHLQQNCEFNWFDPPTQITNAATIYLVANLRKDLPSAKRAELASLVESLLADFMRRVN